MLTSRGRPRSDEGAITIMVALLASVMLLIAALVIDLGLARDIRRQAQNAADASSLAAANVLIPRSGVCQLPAGGAAPCFTDAIAAAKSYAAANYGVQQTEWSGCDDSASLPYTPDSDCISFDNASNPTRVRVLVPMRDVETALGGLADVEDISVAANATASAERRTLPPPVIFANSTTCGDKTLEINGGANAYTGTIHSNDDAKFNGAIVVTGNVDTVGTAQINGAVVTGEVVSGLPVRTDPLAQAGEDIALWRPGSARATALGSAYHNLGSNAVKRDDVTEAGVYYTTEGVTLTSGPPLLNVTFIIDNPNQEKVFQAPGGVVITPYADATNNPNRLQIFSTAGTECDKAVVHMNGNDFSFGGVIYAPYGYVHLNGNNHTTTNGSIVANTIKLNGNSISIVNTSQGTPGGADVALTE